MTSATSGEQPYDSRDAQHEDTRFEQQTDKARRRPCARRDARQLAALLYLLYADR